MRSGSVIKIMGVGDAGGHALNRIADALPAGVDLIAVNTDAAALDQVRVPVRLLIGDSLMHGHGTAGDRLRGERAARAHQTDFEQVLAGASQIFLIAGLGGGTGSGVLPVLAVIARSTGAKITAVVSQPFTFEGDHRRQIAQTAMVTLEPLVDSRRVIDNNRLLPFTSKLRFAPQTASLPQVYDLAAGALAWQVLADITGTASEP